MNEKILFVDDESHILQALKRQLRNKYDVYLALGPKAALEMIEQDGPFAVVVSDMRMPGMDGIQLLKVLQQRSPETIRIMLTGNADQQTAMDAVNEGNVFRFLTKPTPAETLIKTLDAALRQHQLERAEQELLEGTLNGSIKLLTDILSLVAPEAYGQAMIMRDRALLAAEKLGISDTWHIELAAMLAPTALVTIPSEMLAKVRAGEKLDAEEQQIMQRLPEVNRRLMENIPRLDKVANILYFQHKQFDGRGFPDEPVAGEKIPLESRILKVISDQQDLEAKGLTEQDALQEMEQHAARYDIQVLRAVARTNENQGPELALIKVFLSGLRAGQVLASNIETEDGKVLVTAGQKLTEAIVVKLHNYSHVKKIKEPVKVEVEVGGDSDAEEVTARAS